MAELLIDLAIFVAGFLILRKIFPDGSLGFIKIGRDDFGKWHIWWDRD